MPAARRPKIRYSWVTIKPSSRSKKPMRIECMWSMIGSNGENVVSSFPETFRDKTDARRSVRTVMALCGAEPLGSVDMYFREVGPGRKPSLP